MDNRTIAQRLMARARDLERAHVNLYRIRAYRRAAETILGLDEPVETLVSEAGSEALRRLPGIGSSLSERIETLVRTGDFSSLKEAELAAVN